MVDENQKVLDSYKDAEVIDADEKLVCLLWFCPFL